MKPYLGRSRSKNTILRPLKSAIKFVSHYPFFKVEMQPTYLAWALVKTFHNCHKFNVGRFLFLGRVCFLVLFSLPKTLNPRSLRYIYKILYGYDILVRKRLVFFYFFGQKIPKEFWSIHIKGSTREVQDKQSFWHMIAFGEWS